MKKILLLIAIITGAAGLYAQMPQGMPAMDKNIGHVYGKLTDADGKPISGASVMMMQEKRDSAAKKVKLILVKAMVTKSNGDFDFDQLPVAGKLQLKISNSGYTPVEQDISFMPTIELGATLPAPGVVSFDKDLGNIKMATDSK